MTHMHWASLHHHSTFSSRDAFGLPQQHIDRCAELGIKKMVLTEHGNVSSHVRLEIAAEKNGAVQPMYGCEFYTGEVEEETRSQIKNHITVIARNQPGYLQILRLISRAYAEGFYHDATIHPQWLVEEAQSGDLYILSGCTSGELATALIGGKHVSEGRASYERGLEVARVWKECIPAGRYVLEVQPFPELDKTCRINQMLERISDELHLPLVVTGDVHYPLPEHSEIQQILHNVRGGGKQTLEEQAASWGYDVDLSPPTSDKGIRTRLVDTGLTFPAATGAILAAEDIAADVSPYKLPTLPLVRFPVPPGYADAHAFFDAEIRAGWKERGCCNLPDAERKAYKARLRKEYKMVVQKDYLDYFLIVSDVVKWTKAQGIPVGPARGSAAASLICWLLRITEVNPMLYPSMVFERFVDITRTDMPDVDLDFDSRQRSRIFDYCVSKYGEGCVGNIGSFTQYKSKLALDDVARVFKIPKWDVEKIKEVLIERSSGDLRASNTIEDTIEQFPRALEVYEQYPDLRHAMTLEGQVKGIGVHAAGIVIANGPLTDVTAIYRRWVESVQEHRDVIAMDKYDAERQGLIKIDVLGLNTMSMLADCIRLLGWKLDDLYDIDLDDPVMLDGFTRNDVTGVFQFEGRATRSVTGATRPDRFLELVDITALSRPGPMHNGSASLYTDIRMGKEKIRRIHPMYDTITEQTYCLIVYQEQILRIVTEIGLFDWTHASYIRKIISRKIGEEEFNRQWGRFWEGAQENDVPESVAKEIWRNCITSGTYAFNLAHSVSYAMLSAWCMHFKVHHPQVFYAASLANVPGGKKERALELMRDAEAHDITIMPPKIGKSGIGWQPEGRAGLRAGWAQVPNVGEKVANKIIEAKVEKLPDLIAIKGIGPKTIVKLKEFCEAEDPFEIYGLDRLLDWAHGQIRATHPLVLPRPTHTCEEVPHDTKPDDVPVCVLATVQVRNLRNIFEINPSTQRSSADPATARDPHLAEWMIMRAVDGTETCSFAINRYQYPAIKEMLWSIKLDSDAVLFKGVRRKQLGFRYVNVDQMWLIGNPNGDEEEEG